MRNREIRRRFIRILAVYAGFVAIVWLLFHFILSSHNNRNMNETIDMAAYNLLTQLNEEFSQMTAVASVLSGNAHMQDFLTEKNAKAYYEKAETVTEIVGNTVYPQIEADSIIGVAADGAYYRFTGGISGKSIEKISAMTEDGGMAAYSIIELDGLDYFCLITPVYMRDSENRTILTGQIVILSNVAKVRRNLINVGSMSGLEAAVILNDTVLISSRPEFDGQGTAELERLYGSMRISQVGGTNLYVVAAITKEAVNYSERIFFIISFITLIALLVTVFLLYRVLSSRMVSPILQRADHMRSGLLRTQIDDHLVVNTVDSIAKLIEQREYDNAGIAARSLYLLIQSLHRLGDEPNIFDEMDTLSNYLEIVNVRSGGKYEIELDVNEPLNKYCMPARILQPLAENSIDHGFGRMTGDCRLTVTGRIEQDCILFEVSDNGAGMEVAQAAALQEMLDTASDWDYDEYQLKGVALLNIQKRIHMRYGEKYGISVRAGPRQGCTVTVRLPVIADKGKTEE